jgi:hypothetical protein
MILSIVAHRSAATLRLDVTGEIDMETVAPLDQAIAAACSACMDC